MNTPRMSSINKTRPKTASAALPPPRQASPCPAKRPKPPHFRHFRNRRQGDTLSPLSPKRHPPRATLPQPFWCDPGVTFVQNAAPRRPAGPLSRQVSKSGARRGTKPIE